VKLRKAEYRSAEKSQQEKAAGDLSRHTKNRTRKIGLWEKKGTMIDNRVSVMEKGIKKNYQCGLDRLGIKNRRETHQKRKRGNERRKGAEILKGNRSTLQMSLKSKEFADEAEKPKSKNNNKIAIYLATAH